MAHPALYILSIGLVLGAGYYQYKYGSNVLDVPSTQPPAQKSSASEDAADQSKSSPTPSRQEASATSNGGGTESPPSVIPEPDYHNPPFDPENPTKPLYSSSGVRLITINELAAHGVNGSLRPLWLAVAGKVFDVEKGAEHYYGKNGGYNFFTGRDGSKAYVTGEFNDEGLTDDLTGLSPLQLTEIENWVEFYTKDYTYVGLLIGRFYNKEGKPNKAWYKYKKGLGQADLIKAEQRAQERKFPPCNSRYTPEEGGTVFCSTKR